MCSITSRSKIVLIVAQTAGSSLYECCYAWERFHRCQFYSGNVEAIIPQVLHNNAFSATDLQHRADRIHLAQGVCNDLIPTAAPIMPFHA